MYLLGQQLQQAGLEFISAKATHRGNGISIASIVCATKEDVDAVHRWAADRHFPVTARVATAEELIEHRKWSEIAY